MAELKLTVAELSHLLERITPFAEKRSADLAERREDEYTERNIMVKSIEVAFDLSEDEIFEAATEYRNERNKKRWFWQRKVGIDEALHDVKTKLEWDCWHAKVGYKRRFFPVTPIDNITPVLNYLRAVCGQLEGNPNNEIKLSEKETYQVTRAMELADGKDIDA